MFFGLCCVLELAHVFSFHNVVSHCIIETNTCIGVDSFDKISIGKMFLSIIFSCVSDFIPKITSVVNNNFFCISIFNYYKLNWCILFVYNKELFSLY